MELSLFSLLPSHQEAADRDLYDIVLDRAALADELGFRGFWVAEHHARSVSLMPNPAVFLAAAAQRTRRIRLGVAVSVLPMRDPLLVAEDYALVDRLSGGRLDLGVGSGISPIEYAALGQSMEDKREKFEEALAMIRHAWSGRGGAFEGRHRTYGDLHCSVPTLQEPGPPVWRAVGSPEAAHVAGRDGDNALVLASPDMSNYAELSAMAEAHGKGVAARVERNPSEAGGNDSGAAMADRRSASRRGGDAGVRDAGGRMKTPTKPCMGAAVFATAGNSDEEALARAGTGLDRLAAAQGSDPTGREVASAAAESGRAFFGSAQTIRRSLDQLAESGIGQALLWLDFGGGPEAEIAESMKRLAPSAS